MREIIDKEFAEYRVLPEVDILAYEGGFCDFDPSYGVWLRNKQGELYMGYDSPLIACFLRGKVAPKLIASSLLHGIREPKEFFEKSFIAELVAVFFLSQPPNEDPYLDEILSSMSESQRVTMLLAICKITGWSKPLLTSKEISQWRHFFHFCSPKRKNLFRFFENRLSVSDE